ncbi:hypothetical protein AAMO2058_000719900 [Amorphochlora amoebiformis]
MLRSFARTLRFSRLSRSFSTAPKYVSTRGGMEEMGFGDAVLQGLASDRGLMVPTFLPQFPESAPEMWRGLSFEELAYEIMSLYVPDEEIPAEDLKDIINRSYSTFRSPDITPVVPIDDKLNVLELFHGPTFAFKDVALQFLGNLFEYLLASRGIELMTVIGATSGDTGSSAIHGLRGKKGVECFILFPDGRTSPIQERQMTTVLDSNIHNIALKGNFDDAQNIVKALFADLPFKKEYNLGAVNSINWARILAQTVYYVYAYLKVTDAGSTDKVSFSVPTGNFGDILAGFYAKKMGLPVADLVVATNENDILDRFFKTAKYSRNECRETLSPSMDITISSNFERFLYHMAGDDSKALGDMMKTFEATGSLEVDSKVVDKCKAEMKSSMVPDEEVLSTIEEYEKKFGYVLDPHSAIGVAAANKVGTEAKKMVSLACAHWGKFPVAVERAVGSEAMKKLDVPDTLAQLDTMETRKYPIEAETEAVREFIVKQLS